MRLRSRSEPARDQQLLLENKVVLAAVQALIGAITAQVAAISVKVDAGATTADFFVALTEADPVFEDLMDDLPTDITVLTDDAVRVTVHYWIGGRWFEDWPGRAYRLVFGRHVP